jgi:hypothetical protein
LIIPDVSLINVAMDFPGMGVANLLQLTDVIKVSGDIETLGQCNQCTDAGVTHRGNVIRVGSLGANELAEKAFVIFTGWTNHSFLFDVTGCEDSKRATLLFLELQLGLVITDLLIIHLELTILNNGIEQG